MRYLFAFALLAACAESITAPKKAEVATWGDSLTHGGGRDSFANTLALDMGWEVFDGGVPGETSTQVLARFVADTSHREDVQIFWMGRNNFGNPEDVKADIASAIHMLHHNRFLVLSILNADRPEERYGTSSYQVITNLNAQLESIYPDNFVDVRKVLVGAGDIVPDSLRLDTLHLNAEGNRTVAGVVAHVIQTHHW